MRGGSVKLIRAAIPRKPAAVKSGNLMHIPVLLFFKDFVVVLLLRKEQEEPTSGFFQAKSLCASCTTGTTIVNQMTHFASRARSPREAHVKSGRRCASLCSEEKTVHFTFLKVGTAWAGGVGREAANHPNGSLFR